jgi:tetratricopeptide (TPR) repeat protein
MNYFIYSFKALILFFFLISSVAAKESKYFNDGKKLFLEKDFEKSKFYFEKDIVFNPKSENAYLYLAKIHEKNNNKKKQEINLNNVLILNPKNEEAIYMMMKIKISESDFLETDILLKKFELICTSLCSKKSEIKKEINNLSNNTLEKN